MAKVSGSLKLVTGSPAAVSQVWLRAPKGRVQGVEYVTESPDAVQVENGSVSFTALPGPLVMVLVAQGQPLNSVKLIVPDKASATLRECIEAAGLADDGTLNALERLAQEVWQAAQDVANRVPGLVADAVANDSTVLDAAAIAVNDVIGEQWDEKADQAVIDEATSVAGYSTPVHANKLLKLNDEGKIFISTSSIVNQGDPTNKGYVDSQIGELYENKASKQELSSTRDELGARIDEQEPRLLERATSEDAAFSVVDEKGRRTWLEAGHDGSPTKHSRSLINEQIESTDVAFSVLDAKGRRTWLEAGHDGKPTEYSLSLLGGATSGGSAPDFPTADWVHWGDSNTDSARNGAQNWTNVLAGLTGANHYNGGYWGQKAGNIAARQGGSPSLVALENNRTNATGSTPITSAVNLVVGDNADDYIIPGTLAGVPGTITPNATTKIHTFTPDTPGVYNIPPRSVFIPDTGHLRDRHMTIWMGRNDRWDDGAPQKVLRAARHMVDFLTPHVKRFLILQLVPGTDGLDSPRVKDINDALQHEFPAQFVPIAEWMMTEEAATLAGITYTEQDLTDIAEGRIPTSFRRDASHFNEVGCIPIAHFLHREIQERGWL